MVPIAYALIILGIVSHFLKMRKELRRTREKVDDLRAAKNELADKILTTETTKQQSNTVNSRKHNICPTTDNNPKDISENFPEYCGRKEEASPRENNLDSDDNSVYCPPQDNESSILSINNSTRASEAGKCV